MAHHYFRGDLTSTRRITAQLAVNIPAWRPSTDYISGDIILVGVDLYAAASAHTSGSSFATELASGRWTTLASGFNGTSFIHGQTIASTTWVIDHNLGRYPIVQTFNLSFTEIEGLVSHVNLNTTRVEFNIPVTGIALIR